MVMQPSPLLLDLMGRVVADPADYASQLYTESKSRTTGRGRDASGKARRLALQQQLKEHEQSPPPPAPTPESGSEPEHEHEPQHEVEHDQEDAEEEEGSGQEQEQEQEHGAHRVPQRSQEDREAIQELVVKLEKYKRRRDRGINGSDQRAAEKYASLVKRVVEILENDYRVAVPSQ